MATIEAHNEVKAEIRRKQQEYRWKQRKQLTTLRLMGKGIMISNNEYKLK